FCTYDADMSVQLFNDVLAPSEFYAYIFADTDGTILEINESGAFDLNGYAAGTYEFYGISYSGEITGLEVGNNIDDIDADVQEGCFELSPSISAILEVCVDIECPEDITISCDESITPANTGEAEITGDPQGIYGSTFTDEITGECPTIITRTWNLVAPAGVPPVDLSCVQIITVVDEDAPSIIADEEITVECDAVDAPTFLVEDNCDSAPIVNVTDSTEPGDCSGYYTIFRTITATDNCGNTSELVQVINVVDTTAPEFDGDIEDFSVECADDVPEMEDFTATDNC